MLLPSSSAIALTTLGVTFLLDVCPTWTRGVALVDLNDKVRYTI
jgi:hypothetical protein